MTVHNPQQIDIGTVIAATFLTPAGIPFDVSTASTLEMNIKKPDGTSSNKAATLATDGVDGAIKYKTIAGDFDQAGYYYIQGHVLFPSGDSFRSKPQRFRVFANNS